MTRACRKEWKNGRDRDGNHVPFTARIIWFGEGDGDTENIRLQIEDSIHKVSIFPKDKKTADQIWFMFKRQTAPPAGDKTPCVESLLELIRNQLPVKIPDFIPPREQKSVKPKDADEETEVPTNIEVKKSYQQQQLDKLYGDDE